MSNRSGHVAMEHNVSAIADGGVCGAFNCQAKIIKMRKRILQITDATATCGSCVL